MQKNLATTEYFISCDWGTSSIRLYLVNKNTGEVLSNVVSQFGIKRIHNDWEGKRVEYKDKEDFFLDILNDHILLIQQKSNMEIANFPVIASGMITSSIGLKVLPYASLPYDIYGTQAVTELIPAGKKLQHDLLLISGICGDSDVIRGEETQAIGLASQKKLKDGICIFPGTHSKHIYIEDGKIIDFKTYMTGELFDIMVRNSILKESVALTYAHYDEQAFVEGVKAGTKQNLLHSMFGIRGRSLLQETGLDANRNYLSGLLIGNELTSLDARGKHIFLCGGDVLEQYYAEALNTIFPPDKTSVISSNIVDQLVVKGQLMILYHLNQNK